MLDTSILVGVLTEPLTAAQERVLQLLPTSTYLQIADTLYISRNTVKTHLRSIYQKLEVRHARRLSSERSTCAYSESAPLAGITAPNPRDEYLA
jgi:DNA-binding CsgD family transcriptional regulator